MKRAEIQQVSKNLKMYQAPTGKLSIVGECYQESKMTSSRDVNDYLLANWDYNSIGLHETFGILLLNRSNKVIAWMPMFQGGISGTVTDQRMILASALLTFSSGMILAHNHPSGNNNPSEADKAITTKIAESAKMMDIQVLDHMILTPKGEYFSFADNGMI